MAEQSQKQKVYDLLDEKKIAYESMEHQAVFTMEEMEAAGITAKGGVCKNLFLRDAKGKKHFLVVLPEKKRADLAVLASKLGSTKLSFASPERMQKYLGLAQGSVSPFGVINDSEHQVSVVFDDELRRQELVSVHPNDNTASVWLRFHDLETLIKELGNPILFVKLQ